MLAIDRSILCDAVRREDNGKFIAIGIYSASVLVSKFPSTLQFTLLVNLTVKDNDKHKINIRIKVDDEIKATLEGEVQLHKYFSEWMPITLPPIEFVAESILLCEQKIEDGAWENFLEMPIELQPNASA